ncbi:glycosyltransferase family 2 protein [Okeanomitos corallinicola TIOX110]|uniref:Glycosyltransferase family 2 protein n=1 Tax=Okeanomitos corallinicola TIOX110 TaxID=3133117 RepID=A0ABZ2UU39_9CYAN
MNCPSTKSISVILVNYNGADILTDCINSLEKFTSNDNLEIIIVDNNSQDNSIDNLENKYADIKLMKLMKNVGFGAGNNAGAKIATGEFLCFLNTDTILIENTPQILLNYLQQYQDVAVVSPRIIFKDGSYQLSSGKLPSLIVEFFDKIKYGLDSKFHSILSRFYDKQNSLTKEVGWVTGACLMIRRDVFDKLGGFDETFFMYFEDKDLCKRVNDAAFKVVYYPQTSLIHLLGGSSRNAKKSVNHYYRNSQIYYYQKHLGTIQTAILKLYLRISGK